MRGIIPAALKHERVELYNQQRFFTMTGNLLPGMPTSIRDAQPELDALYAEERGSGPQPAGLLPTIDMQALPSVTPFASHVA